MPVSYSFIEYFLASCLMLCIFVGAFRIIRFISDFINKRVHPKYVEQEKKQLNEIIHILKKASIKNKKFTDDFEQLEMFYDSKLFLLVAKEQLSLLRNKSKKYELLEEIDELGNYLQMIIDLKKEMLKLKI